jgi:hypothetical protein
MVPLAVAWLTGTTSASGTQVKWNRQDPHILASSHAKEILIWDRRVSVIPVFIVYNINFLCSNRKAPCLS